VEWFIFSQNLKYLAIRSGSRLYFCQFENDMENDIFMERKIGELCLKKMALKSFSCDFDYNPD
jgi:hypothetical protein